MKDSSWESKHTMMTKAMKRRKVADAWKRRLGGNEIMANLWFGRCALEACVAWEGNFSKILVRCYSLISELIGSRVFKGNTE